MELYQLHDFLCVAKYENISKAAQELHASQPAISKAIRALEDEIKVQLFDRNGKRLSLTRGGKMLANRLKPLLEELDSAFKEIQLQEHHNIETIRINALSGSVFLPDIIRSFKRIEPNVFFEVMEKRESTCWDVCIRSVLPEISFNTAEMILHERILLAVHKDSPIAQMQSVSLRDLENEVFIFSAQGHESAGFGGQTVFRRRASFPSRVLSATPCTFCNTWCRAALGSRFGRNKAGVKSDPEARLIRCG